MLLILGFADGGTALSGMGGFDNVGVVWFVADPGVVFIGCAVFRGVEEEERNKAIRPGMLMPASGPVSPGGGTYTTSLGRGTYHDLDSVGRV